MTGSVFMAADGGLLTDTLVKATHIPDEDSYPDNIAFKLSTGTYVDDYGAEYFFPANDVAQMPVFGLSSGRYMADPQAYYSFGRAILVADRKLMVVNSEGKVEVEHDIETPIYNLVHLGGHDYALISELAISKLSPDFGSFQWTAEMPEVIEDYRVRAGVLYVTLFGGTEYEVNVSTGHTSYMEFR